MDKKWTFPHNDIKRPSSWEEISSRFPSTQNLLEVDRAIQIGMWPSTASDLRVPPVELMGLAMTIREGSGRG